MYAFELSQIFSSSCFEGMAGPSENCFTLDRLSDAQCLDLRKLLTDQGYPDYLDVCDKDLSAVYMSKEKMKGCLLARREPLAGGIFILLLVNFEEYPGNTIEMAYTLTTVAREKGFANSFISFAALDKSIKSLVVKILGAKSKLEEVGFTLHGIRDTDEDYEVSYEHI